MYIPFEEITDTSRVWIYQSDRPFTNEEKDEIEQMGQEFANQWEAHGQPLKSSVSVFYHQFIVIAVDESYNTTTGCSIDSSVGFIRKVAEEFGVDLFGRTNIAFLDRDKVVMHKMKDLKDKVAKGEIERSTVTFNNLVSDKASFDKDWKVAASDSWLARYF